MRVRRLDSDGDYSFGRGQGDFLKDSPEAVAQNIRTRLLLQTGEWFLDVTDGTAWAERILGSGTSGTYDDEVRQRILGTPGVRALLAYESKRVGRRLSVTAKVDTIYGEATVTV